MKYIIVSIAFIFGLTSVSADWKDDVQESVPRHPDPGDWEMRYSPTRGAMHRAEKFSR